MKSNLTSNVIYASDLFAVAAHAARAAHEEHVRSNAALATNKLRAILAAALAEHKGKLAYNAEHNRWEVQFGKRDSYWPEGLVLQHLRAMEDRARQVPVRRPHLTRRVA